MVSKKKNTVQFLRYRNIKRQTTLFFLLVISNVILYEYVVWHFPIKLDRSEKLQL